MADDVDAAVFISAVTAGDLARDSDFARALNASLWHLIDVDLDRTFCGHDIPGGARRVAWNETALVMRCPSCVQWLGRA